MSTIQYNFKSIPIIPTANNLIDIILSRTQTKTPTVTHPGYKITRIRKFYMRKVRFTYSTIQEKLEGIINYAKDYCELGKKIYVLGMLSGNQDEVRCINKSEITKIMDQIQVNYEYKEINLSKTKEVSDTIMEVIDYSSKHSINSDLRDEREAAQGKSCVLF